MKKPNELIGGDKPNAADLERAFFEVVEMMNATYRRTYHDQLFTDRVVDEIKDDIYSCRAANPLIDGCAIEVIIDLTKYADIQTRGGFFLRLAGDMREQVRHTIARFRL